MTGYSMSKQATAPRFDTAIGDAAATATAKPAERVACKQASVRHCGPAAAVRPVQPPKAGPLARILSWIGDRFLGPLSRAGHMAADRDARLVGLLGTAAQHGWTRTLTAPAAVATA